jgi:hypothetical protein
MHGLYLAVHRTFRGRRKQVRPSFTAARGIRIPLVVIVGLFNFLLVALTWIPFRCAAFGDTVTCLHRIFTCASVSVGTGVLDSGQLAVCWLLVGLVLLFDAFYKCEFLYWQNKRWPVLVKALLPAIFILLTIVFGASEAQQFIYFQF